MDHLSASKKIVLGDWGNLEEDEEFILVECVKKVITHLEKNIRQTSGAEEKMARLVTMKSALVQSFNLV